jgi:hypothetical protein
MDCFNSEHQYSTLPRKKLVENAGTRRCVILGKMLIRKEMLLLATCREFSFRGMGSVKFISG